MIRYRRHTGAAGERPGLLDEASGGTLFLDEIADMPLRMQPKLLRALQEGEGTRLGSNRARSYDLRLICASNRDLALTQWPRVLSAGQAIESLVELSPKARAR